MNFRSPWKIAWMPLWKRRLSFTLLSPLLKPIAYAHIHCWLSVNVSKEQWISVTFNDIFLWCTLIQDAILHVLTAKLMSCRMKKMAYFLGSTSPAIPPISAFHNKNGGISFRVTFVRCHAGKLSVGLEWTLHHCNNGSVAVPLSHSDIVKHWTDWDSSAETRTFV